jgi:hypothetical protein
MLERRAADDGFYRILERTWILQQPRSVSSGTK